MAEPENKPHDSELTEIAIAFPALLVGSVVVADVCMNVLTREPFPLIRSIFDN